MMIEVQISSGIPALHVTYLWATDAQCSVLLAYGDGGRGEVGGVVVVGQVCEVADDQKKGWHNMLLPFA